MKNLKTMKMLFGILALFTAHVAQAKPYVVTTLPNFADLARKIGGANVEVKSLIGTGIDPHFVPAKPTFLVDLNKADLLISVGAKLEAGWLPTLIRQSGNNKIKVGSEGSLDLSQAVSLMEVATGKVSRAMGDVHPSGNPHYFLSPAYVPAMARAIAVHLAKIDPSNASLYSSNLANFTSSWNAKAAGWKSRLNKGSVTVVSYHRSLSYLLAWAGWTVFDTIEAKPGIPPSSARLSELIETLPKNGVKVILSERWYSAKDSRFLSEKTGIPLVLIDGLTNDYTAYFEALVNALAGAIK